MKQTTIKTPQSNNKEEFAPRREETAAKDLESGVKYLDLKAAGRYASLSFWTIREYVLSGQLPSVKLPHPFKPGKYLRRILIDRDDLDSFLQSFKLAKNHNYQKQ